MANPFNADKLTFQALGVERTITLGYRPLNVQLTDQTDGITYLGQDCDPSIGNTTTVLDSTGPAISHSNVIAFTDTGVVIDAAILTLNNIFTFSAIREESRF